MEPKLFQWNCHYLIQDVYTGKCLLYYGVVFPKVCDVMSRALRGARPGISSKNTITSKCLTFCIGFLPTPVDVIMVSILDFCIACSELNILAMGVHRVYHFDNLALTTCSNSVPTPCSRPSLHLQIRQPISAPLVVCFISSRLVLSFQLSLLFFYVDVFMYLCPSLLFSGKARQAAAS